MLKQTVDYIVTVDIDEAKTFLKFCDLINGVIEYDRASNTEELAATDSQQLKPKMPSFEEAYSIVRDIPSETSCITSFYVGTKMMYEYIARHFGH